MLSAWFFPSFFYISLYMHHFLLSFLRFFARCIIVRHKPYIIGITGSVGKTTLTTHIATYLRLLYGDAAVGYSPYHYNGEYGLPLTIIWARTGGKNPFLWIAIFLKAFWRCLWPYPRYLVLEYGIDHPGEMEYLISIARPHIAILSRVAPNHLEQFGTFDRYREAKLLLIESAYSQVIVQESLRECISRKDAFFYGKEESSYAYITHTEQKETGIQATIRVAKRSYPIVLPSFWDYQVENILPLYILAEILGWDTSIIASNAPLFAPESGRSRILRGIEESIIIDGSYNGGFESICRGIDSVTPFVASHRIICLLGDMRELGQQSGDIHRALAQYIEEHLSHGRDIALYLVWPLMIEYVVPLLPEYMTCMSSLSSRKLGDQIWDILCRDPKPTIIYVKWSQNTIFLEEGIKKFLQNPQEKNLLCRQSEEWMRKKEEFFWKI